MDALPPVRRPERVPEYEANENNQVKSTKGADMGYFYFARHGQTVWNVENKICGATDIALTEKGHEQAKELGRKILDEGIHIDEIICSPLMRAADTGKTRLGYHRGSRAGGTGAERAELRKV